MFTFFSPLHICKQWEKGRETYYVNSLFIGEVQAVYSTVSGTVYSTVFPN